MNIEQILTSIGFQGEIRQQEELKRCTSFSIGGPADFFIIPSDRNELKNVIQDFRGKKIAYRILGNGTNLLVSDEGVRGMIIKIGPGLGNYSFQGNTVLAESGAPLTALAQAAAQRGLSGLEFAAGIPGTVGGAVVMNAGWQGRDMSQILKTVRAFNPGKGIKNYINRQCRFTYRGSRFRGGDEIILAAECELKPDSTSAIKEKTKENLKKRRRKFPLRYPSAGSIFKNPPGDFAGRLIETAGLKGKRVGDAQISEKHANFIINQGRARSGEVLELIELVRQSVKEKFDIDLELEIEIWK